MTRPKPKTPPAFVGAVVPVAKPRPSLPLPVLILLLVILAESAILLSSVAIIHARDLRIGELVAQERITLAEGDLNQSQLEIAQDFTDSLGQELRDKDRHIAWLEKRHKEDQGKITELQGQDALLVDMVKRLQDKQP